MASPKFSTPSSPWLVTLCLPLLPSRKPWMEFYVQLFSSQVLDQAEQDFFVNSILKKMNPEQQLLCEGPLTEPKCKRALDGFPTEFYKRFWTILGADYVEVLNYCFATGRLSGTQRSSVITLLHKKGDCLNMKNWRPITLLCVDYKIVAKVLAKSCGFPGRNPNKNCCLLKDVIYNANHHNTRAVVLSLNQEKAFDRVE